MIQDSMMIVDIESLVNSDKHSPLDENILNELMRPVRPFVNIM